MRTAYGSQRRTRGTGSAEIPQAGAAYVSVCIAACASGFLEVAATGFFVAVLTTSASAADGSRATGRPAGASGVPLG